MDRVFELISAILAGPYVSHTIIRQMPRPFWCNNSGTTLRTLAVTRGGHLPMSPTTKQKPILRRDNELLLIFSIDLRTMSRECPSASCVNRTPKKRTPSGFAELLLSWVTGGLGDGGRHPAQHV